MQQQNKINRRKQKNKFLLVMLFIAITIPLMASTCGGDPPPADPNYSISANSLAVTQGESGPTQVTVTSTGGFSDMVSLNLQGAPTGVSGSFNPSSTDSNSILILTVSASVGVGTYPLTIKGESAELTRVSPEFNLVVNAKVDNGAFELTASSVTIRKNTVASSSLEPQVQTSGTVDVDIARKNSFAGAIAFRVEGLPTGVTSSFTPNPALGNSSSLRLLVSRDAPAGSHSVTIKGTSGDKEATTVFNLTIEERSSNPDFSITASDVIVEQGKEGNAAITISKTGGFSGNVSLTKTGIPDNVTALFETTGATTTLKLNVGLAATRGDHTITVTGTGGGKTHSTTFKLTVESPDSAAIVAYAWADNKTSSSYTPNTTYSYNKIGGTIIAKKLSNGQYTIKFPDVLPGANVQVTAWHGTTSDNYCQFRGWTHDGSIAVACFDSGGHYKDSKYYITVTKKGAVSTVKPTAYAFAHKFDDTANYAPLLNKSYNVGRGAINIHFLQTGSYTVSFSNLPTFGANVQVTAFDSNKYCVSGGNISTIFVVNCFDHNGNLANSRFLITVAEKNVSNAEKIVGYASADSLSGSQYSASELDSFTSSDGQITIQNIGIGGYSVAFAGVSGVKNVQVTSVNSFAKCGVESWTGSSVKVNCYNSTGVLADSKFNVILYK